jgi:hypothetical protein
MILPVGVRGDLRSGWEDPRVERRTFLVLGAAAVGLAGCTSNATEPGPPSAAASPIPPEDPDARLREEVAASEVALIVAYRSAIEANPELAASLGPFLAHHEEHLARVAPGFSRDLGSVASESTSAPSPPTGGSSDPDDASAVRSGSPDATPSGSPEVRASSVVSELAAAESAAHAQRATACDGVQDPGLARDLCLIAAS